MTLEYFRTPLKVGARNDERDDAIAYTKHPSLSGRISEQGAAHHVLGGLWLVAASQRSIECCAAALEAQDSSAPSKEQKQFRPNQRLN